MEVRPVNKRGDGTGVGFNAYGAEVAATKALIIDSDARSADLLTWLFKREGFEVLVAGTGSEGLSIANNWPPDLVLIDFELDDAPGINISRRLREDPPTLTVPLIMIASSAGESDRAAALDIGVDDFIVRPFGTREFIAKVYALLRRAQNGMVRGRLSYAGLEMDATNYKVKRDSRAVPVSPSQFRLLRHFMENPGRAFSRKELLETLWASRKDVDERSVDAQIRRLRKELNGPGERELLRTIRGIGYSLDGDGNF
ncbi:MAG: winged helix-turn-helix domain-containing protein [Sphingosinicella sp.]|nr:winged helix-turn-helix domain-containing protein [Sphingosinicella sp.]